MMSPDEPDYIQLPVFENRFTSNELDELLSFFQPKTNQSGGTLTRKETVSSNSGSEEPTNQTFEEVDEKKEKRKVSNRESAKRSRCRKKRRLEDLTAQASRLKARNRDYRNRLSSILYELHQVEIQNDRLRLESVGLLRKHSYLNRVLEALQFQYETSFINTLNVEGNGPFLSLQRYSF